MQHFNKCQVHHASFAQEPMKDLLWGRMGFERPINRIAKWRALADTDFAFWLNIGAIGRAPVARNVSPRIALGFAYFIYANQWLFS